jgi:hypothetical protein
LPSLLSFSAIYLQLIARDISLHSDKVIELPDYNHESTLLYAFRSLNLALALDILLQPLCFFPRLMSHRKGEAALFKP